MSKPLRRIAVGLLTLGIVLCQGAAARADFFDDARGTFQNDIPHFFQDDIPCAFGGQPTSHTKTSCKEPDASAKPPKTGAVAQPARPSAEVDPDRRRDRTLER